MDTTTSARELEAVRQRRAEMHETLAALQRGLTTDAGLGAALDRLATEFALYVEVTEGPDGLHQAILAAEGLTTPVRPITTAELGRPAPRPAYSVLENLNLQLAGVPLLPPWQESLETYLAQARAIAR